MSIGLTRALQRMLSHVQRPEAGTASGVFPVDFMISRSQLSVLLGATVGLGALVVVWPELAMSAMVLLALGIGVVRYPGAMFAAYLYIPLYKGVLEPWLFFDLTLVLAVSCSVLAVPLLWDLLRSGGSNLWFVVLAWSLIWLVISVGAYYAPNPGFGHSQAVEFTALVFLPCLFGIRVARNLSYRSQFVWATALFSIGVILVGMSSLVWNGSGRRLEVLGTNTIGTGRAALLLPMVAVPLARLSSRRIANAMFAAIPFGIVVALATGSRGPLLMGMVSLVVMAFVTRILSRRMIIWAGVGGVALVVVAQLLAMVGMFPRYATERIQTTLNALVNPFSDEKLNLSDSLRVDYAEASIEMFMDRPIAGFGTGSFYTASYQEDLAGLVRSVYPHNFILQFLAEYGVVGATLCFLLIGFALYHGLRQARRPDLQALFILAVFAVLSSLVSSGIVDNRWLWGSLLMVGATPVLGKDLASTSRVQTGIGGHGPINQGRNG